MEHPERSRVPAFSRGGRVRVGLLVFVFFLGPRSDVFAQETPPVEPMDDLIIPPPDDFLVELPATALPERRTPGDPARVRALMREAGMEVQAGNHEAAASLFRRVLHAAPNERAARFGLGTSLLAIGEYQESEQMLRNLLGEFDDDHIVLNNLAWLYATARNIQFRDGERALRYARQALLLAPSAHYVWSTMAEAYYVSGQYAQAVRAAEQAIHLARERGAEETQQRDYQRLLEKSRHAARAFEILD